MRNKNDLAQMYEMFNHLVEPVKDRADWTTIREELLAKGFFVAPASTKYHGNYEGGLWEHSLMVTNALLHLTEKLNLTWTRKESPYYVGLFHDLCKCDRYKYYEVTQSYRYSEDMLFTGHGDKSVMIASTLVSLTEEEVACIRYHMGAFTDKEEWGKYTKAVNTYPNVLYTHTADMIASHIFNT